MRYRRKVALNINDQAAVAHWTAVGKALIELRFGKMPGDAEG